MMKKCFKTLLLLFAGLFWLLVNTVYSQFTVKGELRPRTEFRHGYKTLPDTDADPALFTEQRSRFILEYDRELYQIGFSLQDVRIWGSESQLNKSDGLFSVHEAWGKINFNESVSLKAGRQELVYDDQRILGNVGWTAQGRSHDAMLFMIEGKDWDLHTGLAFNQDVNSPEPVKLFGTYYSGVQNYKTLQYLWLHRKFESSEISMLVLNNGIQMPDSSVNFTQTTGFSGTHRFTDVELKSTVYYQTGKDPAGSDLNAWLASLSVAYSGLKNPDLTLGIDYLSGSGAGDRKNRSFNPLYGTHHKFYGLMDYFYVGSPHNQRTGTNTNAPGLVDLFLKTSFRFSAATSLLVHGHQFYSPVEILDPAAPARALRPRLGTEIDLVFSHSLSDEVNIQVGYSQMFATSSLEVLKEGSQNPPANWAWVMLTFNPVFLKM